MRIEEELKVAAADNPEREYAEDDQRDVEGVPGVRRVPPHLACCIEMQPRAHGLPARLLMGECLRRQYSCGQAHKPACLNRLLLPYAVDMATASSRCRITCTLVGRRTDKLRVDEEPTVALQRAPAGKAGRGHGRGVEVVPVLHVRRTARTGAAAPQDGRLSACARWIRAHAHPALSTPSTAI